MKLYPKSNDMSKRASFSSLLIKLLTPLLLLALLSAGCSKEPEENKKEPYVPDPLGVIKTYTSNIMNDIYYWYKEVPKGLNPKEFDAIDDYFYAHLVKKDRWSWMMTGKEFLSSEAGISESYGASLGQAIDHYDDYGVRIRFVHPNSPLGEKGVERGWELTHLNGTAVMQLISQDKFDSEYNKTTNHFTFLNNSGDEVSFTASSREIQTRSVLLSEVYSSNEWPSLPHKVGYLHYLSFKAGMINDIDEAMALFKSEGVQDLILDLRYNGGGDDRATTTLAGYIAPFEHQGKVLSKKEHNDRYKNLSEDPDNHSKIGVTSQGLNLPRLFVLTGKGSASASEVIINGLKPYMEVIQIGRTTYGKPNGMYVLSYPENNYTSPLYIFLPVSFFTVNADGEGDYLDGLVPTHSRADDLYHPFSPEEELIKAALHYITEGSFPSAAPTAVAAPWSGPRHRYQTKEEKSGYGLYTVVPN